MLSRVSNSKLKCMTDGMGQWLWGNELLYELMEYFGGFNFRSNLVTSPHKFSWHRTPGTMPTNQSWGFNIFLNRTSHAPFLKKKQTNKKVALVGVDVEDKS